jgi:Rrf2 family protein
MLSTTAEYGLRAMVFIASHSHIPTRQEIASATQIPSAYLVKVLKLLEQAELITSKRGPGGGYNLTGTAESCTVYDIISAIAELPRIEKCPLGLTEHIQLCPLHARLDEVARLAEEAYRQTTLAELLPGRGKSDQCAFPTKLNT